MLFPLMFSLAVLQPGCVVGMKKFHRRRGKGNHQNLPPKIQGSLTAQDILAAYERNPRALPGIVVKTSIGLVLVVKE